MAYRPSHREALGSLPAVKKSKKVKGAALAEEAALSLDRCGSPTR